jgi:hypothetical protein
MPPIFRVDFFVPWSSIARTSLRIIPPAGIFNPIILPGGILRNVFLSLCRPRHINRRTVENVQAVGLHVLSVTPLWRDILLQIEAAKGS